MAPMRHASLFVAVLALACAADLCAAHGWMQFPVPLAGGGEGSGNAGTSSPCNLPESYSTSPTVTWFANDTITIHYKRANNHGASRNSVDFTIAAWEDGVSVINNALINGGTRVLNNARMNTDTSATQTASFVLPADTSPGTYLGRWDWVPANGGQWFDCVFVTILNGTNSCLVDNGGCANSTCVPLGEGTNECRCPVGFYGPWDACLELPPEVSVRMRVRSVDAISQDPFTASVADLLDLPVGRVLYDRYDVVRKQPNNQEVRTEKDVYFALVPDQITGEAPTEARALLLDLIGDPDDLDFPFIVTEVTVDGTLYARADIDHCALDGACDPKATCKDDISQALCTCLDGYAGSGLNRECYPILELFIDAPFHGFSIHTFKRALASYLRVPVDNVVILDVIQGGRHDDFAFTPVVTLYVIASDPATTTEAIVSLATQDDQGSAALGSGIYGVNEVATEDQQHEDAGKLLSTASLVTVIIMSAILCLLCVCCCVACHFCRRAHSRRVEAIDLSKKKLRGSKSSSGSGSGSASGSASSASSSSQEAASLATPKPPPSVFWGPRSRF